MGKYALPPLIMLFNEEMGSPSNSSYLSHIAKPHFFRIKKTHYDSWRKIGVSTTKTLKDRGQGSQIHGFLFFYLHLHVSLINPKNTVFSTQIHLVSLLGCPWKLVSS